jgi:hypothetical protein
MPFRLRRSFALAAVVGATVFATTACDADGDAPADAVQSGDAGSPAAGTPAAGTPSASASADGRTTA